jgi:outer membrane lipoprotein-sorting protein
MFLRKLTIVLAFVISFSQVYSQSVDEIINKVLEKRGDVAKYKALNSIIFQGSQMQTGISVPFKLCIKDMNNKVTKYYLESEAMGSKQQMCFNGDSMWAFAGQLQTASAKDVPEDNVKGFIQQISQVRDFSETPLLRYKEKGHKIELSGSVTEDGRDAYTLRFIQKGEQESYLYVDKNNFELFKIAATMKSQDKNGNEIDVDLEMNYSDYKDVNGFTIPHKMVLKMGEFGTIDITLEKVEYNPVIDDAIFNVPKVEKKTE